MGAGFTGVSGRFSLTDAAKKTTMRIRNLPQGGPAMKQYVIALDQGTTSSRAILFDREQNIIAMGQKEFPQHYPKAGYVEHDPMEIYSRQFL